jgi:hypothetical protein
MSTIAMPTPTYVLMVDFSSLVIRPPYIRSRSRYRIRDWPRPSRRNGGLIFAFDTSTFDRGSPAKIIASQFAGWQAERAENRPIVFW